MAEQNQKKQIPKQEEKMQEDTIIRILGYDIPGSTNVYTGMTKIKGVSWGISNAACIKLNIPRTKKISELTKEEIKKFEEFIKNPEIRDFLKNRRRDRESGESKHFIGTDLEMRKDFDIRRLKKIRSYKGLRHIAKLPVRGQRTRSHFRKKGQALSVKRKK